MVSWYRGLQRKAVEFLVVGAAIFVPFGFGPGSDSEKSRTWIQSAWALPDEERIPHGWESYLDRPDILEVQARSHEMGKTWETLKAAHFSFVAKILTLYPASTHFYFLARDGEYLFDVARMVTKGTPDEHRVHLLNVSRVNMGDVNIKAYLRENGISEETLASGRQVLLLDTGFAGTIPRAIRDLYPARLRTQIKAHLVASSDTAIPSSRTFLIHLNPSANEQLPSKMHGSILSYEHMPRFTDRSVEFVFSGGRYHPVSPMSENTDGVVSKKESLRYMQDLRAEWEKQITRMKFAWERDQVESLKRLMTSSDPKAPERIIHEISKKGQTYEGRLFVSHVLDIIDAAANAELDLKVTLTDLGLTLRAGQGDLISTSKKMDYLKKYPHWAPYLEDPVTYIPPLALNKNWQMMRNLIEANIDSEINLVLMILLFEEPGAQGVKKDLQLLLIDNADKETLRALAEHLAFTELKGMEDVLRRMIEKGDSMILRTLASGPFTRPEAADMGGLIRLLIERGDGLVLQNLARYVFSAPHTKGMEGLLKLLIEKADKVVLQDLAQFTFSNPHTRDNRDHLRLVIERGDSEILRRLARYTFALPHTRHMQEELRLLIEKGDSSVWQELARQTFSQPHAVDMKELIKILIDKGDPATLRELAQHTFSRPHAKFMTDLLRRLIEKGDRVTLMKVAAYAFSQPHAKDMKDLLELLVLKADPEVMKDLVRSAFSKPHTAEMTDLLKRVIQRSDMDILMEIATSVLTQPHSRDMKGVLKQVLEKGNVQLLKLYTASILKHHRDTPEYRVWVGALDRDDPVQRKKWMETELAKMKSPLAEPMRHSRPVLRSQRFQRIIVPRTCQDIFR